MQHAVAAAAVVGAVVAFALSHTGLRTLHGLLASRSPLPPGKTADVAIVLGYALFRNGSLTEPLKGRVQAGVELFLQGRAQHLLFSGAHPGGGVTRVSEANVMQGYAEGLLRDMRGGGGAGGPDELVERWHQEDQSTSTYENALFSLDICRQRGWTRLLVVTSPFHQIRSELVFRKLVERTKAEGGPAIEVYMAPAPFVPHRDYPLPLLDRCVDAWDWARELLAVAYYAALGRLW
ncbi:hypothetical protein HYH03_008442 [Edaphochlamys debaryana]|uniref:DUF218 domain-containing protein n=1 Tax=Edaphochlamys debaryana TaxID=47281 RepID=A0A835XZW8_9CHLO|nr:hypothetical protein HYH03_008442 [Edaphochlamys debaryana]|eukprot:KAG2493306.1 hypothetical protein HYH03_008442 [Edaphochlamys debaryana]